jgi:hypothetical protein
MSTQYRLVQSGKTASGGCSAGQGSSEPVAPRIFFFTSREENFKIKAQMKSKCYKGEVTSVLPLPKGLLSF